MSAPWGLRDHVTIVQLRLLSALHMPITPTDTQPQTLDPVRLLIRSFKVILLGAFIGGALGLLASHAIHPHWTAKMAIQLGQVSIPDARGSLAVQPLENQLTAIERYNLPSFRLQVLNELGLPSPDTGNPEADLIFKSLKATAARSPQHCSPVQSYLQGMRRHRRAGWLPEHGSGRRPRG